MQATLIIHTRAGDRQRTFDAPAPLHALIETAHPCGGLGKCSKCRIRAEGALSVVTEQEKGALSGEEIAWGMRLSCQTQALGDVQVWLDEAENTHVLTQFSLSAQEDDGAGIGLAVDIGTTTVAAYLYDLQTQTQLCVASCENPQRALGADVISRLSASLAGKGDVLHEKIAAVLASLCGKMLKEAGKTALELQTAVVTGNTAMLYLLTGQEVASIAAAPFAPSTTFGQAVPGGEIGLPDHVKAWLPDCAAAYVGADITCAMLYAGFDGQAAETVLLADIGTNGEMALKANGRIYVCSTAAGPAFEGAGISQGMTARRGAIDRVELKDALCFHVIGEKRAQGICGSGLVDAVAALLEAGAIDESGRLLMQGHALERCMSRRGKETVFTFPGTSVAITQSDVRAVQLAKAAICAGMRVLMQEAGCAGVDKLLVAGGFGTAIRPEAAEAIGLIPPGAAARTEAIGNAAGAGAAMMLLSAKKRLTGTKLAKACRVVELSGHPLFSDAYIDCMAFA